MARRMPILTQGNRILNVLLAQPRFSIRPFGLLDQHQRLLCRSGGCRLSSEEFRNLAMLDLYSE